MTHTQFKEARQQLGLTQRQMAALWGMGLNGERTIRRWETGKIPVNPIAAYCVSLMVSAV